MRIGRLFLIMLNASGFSGLYVETYGTISLLFSLSFVLSKSFLGIANAFAIPF